MHEISTIQYVIDDRLVGYEVFYTKQQAEAEICHLNSRTAG
jgi:hypothetical protein